MSDYTALSSRICAQTAHIANVLADRVHIDPRFVEFIDLRPACAPQRRSDSLTVAEQLDLSAAFDRIASEVDGMCRLTAFAKPQRPAAAAPGRQQALKRSASVSGSRDQLHKAAVTASSPSIDESVDPNDSPTAGMPPVPLVTSAEVRAFNATAPEPETTTIAPDLCDRDKQMFRPFFKVVPKLREFALQIQRLVETTQQSTNTDVAEPAKDTERLGDLLSRLHEVIVVDIHIFALSATLVLIDTPSQSSLFGS